MNDRNFLLTITQAAIIALLFIGLFMVMIPGFNLSDIDEIYTNSKIEHEKYCANTTGWTCNSVSYPLASILIILGMFIFISLVGVLLFWIEDKKDRKWD